MKKLFLIISAIFMLIVASGCSSSSKIPFNGSIQFHKISAIIPEKYIRDSTQSTDDLWIFEHGAYSEYILISRSDINGEISSSLENYVNYMKENNAESEIGSFLETDAVYSTYYIEDILCQEILFSYDDSFYAIALRGGDENGFNEIVNTVKVLE